MAQTTLIVSNSTISNVTIPDYSTEVASQKNSTNIVYTDNTLDLNNLVRTPEVQASYDLRLKEIKEAKSTPSEVILKKLEGKKLAKVLNEFPYDLGEGLEHYLVWFLDFENTSTFETTLFEPAIFYIMLRDEEKIEIPKEKLVALFENTPSKKSVDLKHYHLILRK